MIIFSYKSLLLYTQKVTKCYFSYENVMKQNFFMKTLKKITVTSPYPQESLHFAALCLTPP